MKKTEKILVTGADGFIGSHLTEYLVRQGYSVKAFCCYNSFGYRGWLEESPKDIKDELEFCLGDIRDYGSLEAAMKGCNAVFHLASLIAIPYSYQAPESYIDTNIKGTLNVVKASLQNGVEQVIHTSTSEVYGSAQYVPIDEHHPLVGQSPYSASKIGADQIALSFHKSFDLPLSIVRPFNTYGPRQSARAIIPTIITQLLSGKTTLSLGNLNATRDLSFYLDTVKGMTSFLGNTGSIGETINLGTGFEITIKDLALMLADIMGVSIDFEMAENRLRPEKSEVARLCANNDKAKNILRWKPEYSDVEGLRKGLQLTLEWFKNIKDKPGYDPNQYMI